jgi:dihydroorotate dehydrogenase (NAD+) catalytic subunit
LRPDPGPPTTGLVPAAPSTGGWGFLGLELAHPIVNGSGTYDAIAARRAFGDALLERFPFSAFVSKTITLEPRAGNPPPRLYETPAGLINSIGLPNKGLRGYLADDLPELARLPVPLITNVMGSTADEIAALLEAVDARPEIDAVELNVSCPNVKTGLDIGADPRELGAVVAQVRPRTTKPLIVKLTPNAADPAAAAQAAEAAGADAVSLINTLRAFAPHPRIRSHPPRPWLGGGTGGLSGPAIRAVALAQVRAVAQRIAIPIVGMGGVQTGRHAAHLLEAGATVVAVGTENFRDPAAGERIQHELHDLFAKSGDISGRRELAPRMSR